MQSNLCVQDKIVNGAVVVPGYNEEIDDLIMFANELGAMLGIQKYEHHKFGRRLKVKEWTWHKFFSWLKELEKHGTKLVLKEDFDT